MKVKIISSTSYQTFPITDDMIEIDELVLNEIGKTKCFENGKVVDYTPTSLNWKRIAELKRLLAETDYKAIQFAEGEITAEDFEPIKIERRNWRVEINKLQQEYGIED